MEGSIYVDLIFVPIQPVYIFWLGPLRKKKKEILHICPWYRLVLLLHKTGGLLPYLDQAAEPGEQGIPEMT